MAQPTTLAQVETERVLRVQLTSEVKARGAAEAAVRRLRRDQAAVKEQLEAVRAELLERRQLDAVGDAENQRQADGQR
jgi:hypothetical protein